MCINMKRTSTVYVDAELIARAKAAGLNISKELENALYAKLSIPTKIEEETEFDKAKRKSEEAYNRTYGKMKIEEELTELIELKKTLEEQNNPTNDEKVNAIRHRMVILRQELEKYA